MRSKKLIVILFLLLLCNIVYAETDSVDFDVERDCEDEKLQRAKQNLMALEDLHVCAVRNIKNTKENKVKSNFSA